MPPVLKIALRAILRNKLRSSLTILGIVIGVGAVIVMVGIGQGAKDLIEKQIESLGTNVLIIIPVSTSHTAARGTEGTITLTAEDVAAIAKECREVSHVSANLRTASQVVYGNQNWSTSIVGIHPDYQIIRNWELEAGRFIRSQDVKIMAKVCVLGQTVVVNLFGSLDRWAGGYALTISRSK